MEGLPQKLPPLPACLKFPGPLPVGQQGGPRAALVLFHAVGGPVGDYLHSVVPLSAFLSAASAARSCSLASGVTPRAGAAFCLQQSGNEMLGEEGEGRGAIAYASDKEVDA